jgi:hypothetical protein
MTSISDLHESIAYGGLTGEASVGSYPVEAPVIDHEYVRRLEDRNKWLERSLERAKFEHRFMYDFAAQHIVYLQAGREYAQIQELLDSLEVSLRLTYPRYQEIIDTLVANDYLDRLQHMVADWHRDDYQEEADE